MISPKASATIFRHQELPDLSDANPKTALRSTRRLVVMARGDGVAASDRYDFEPISASRCLRTFSAFGRAHSWEFRQGSRAAVEVDQRINGFIELRGCARRHALHCGYLDAVCV
jgi:hypothetical protein